MDAKSFEKWLRFAVENHPTRPTLVYGHTGIGKTAIPRMVAHSTSPTDCLIASSSTLSQAHAEWIKAHKSIDYRYVNATGCDAPDLMGLPAKDLDITKFLPPDFLKAIEDSPVGIFCMDEVNRLPHEVRNVWMQALDERRLGNVTFPDGWHIVMTANPADEGYQVSDFDVALVRRSIVMELRYDLDIWRDWGINQYTSKVLGKDGQPLGLPIDARVISAAGRYAKALSKDIDNRVIQTYTPFGMQVCSELVQAGLFEKFEREESLQILAGVAGNDFAQGVFAALSDTKLQEYLKRAMDGTLKPEECSGPDKHDLMIDLLFMFWEKICKSPVKYAKATTNFYRCLNKDIRPALMKMLNPFMQKDPDKFTELVEDWQKWCTEQYKRSKGLLKQSR